MTITSATKTIRTRPITGWALDNLILLDAACPGILRFALQASPLRRQGIFFALSHLHPGSPDRLAARLSGTPDHPTASDPLQIIAVALMTMRVRKIVRALHLGGVRGLVGALGRIGTTPLPPAKYRLLVEMLTDSDQRQAKLIRQMPSITERLLDVLAVLNPAFLVCFDLLHSFHAPRQVEAFNAAVHFIKQVVPNVTEADLVASVRALGPTSTLEDWSQRWLLKALMPVTPPIHDDEEWRVLRSGAALKEAGERFRCCLKDKIGGSCLGRVGYVEWLREPAIIELVALAGADGTTVWAMDGIYAPQNGRVHREVVVAISRKLRTAGILVPAKLVQRHFNRAASLIGVYEFDAIGRVEGDEDEMEAMIDAITRDAMAA